MTQPGHDEPPREFIWYSLAEALRLLQGLGDARDALARTGHLAGAVLLGDEFDLLRRKLELENPEGDADDG